MICVPPPHIAFVLRRLEENGYAAYIVGGCVRDAVMGRAAHDWDVTTSAAPEAVARLFPKTVPTGERFGTVTVLVDDHEHGGVRDTVEVTTFRTDGEYRDGRRPDSVKPAMSLDEDLCRRDFTMNAMAASVDGEIIDPFGGLEDIENRVIRCVGVPDERFKEDALRMFRAFRFSARLGFEIERETLSAVYANAGRARLISAERVRVELEKTITSQKPEIACEMINAGLLDRYLSKTTLPDFYNLHSLVKLPTEPVPRWCALCAVLIENRLITSAGRFLRDLRLDAKTIKICSSAMQIRDFHGDRAGVKRLLAERGQDAVRCAAAVGDALRGGSALKGVDEVIASGECFSLSGLAVSGRELIKAGYKPGCELGEMLNRLLDHVIDHPADNSRDVLLDIAKINDRE